MLTPTQESLLLRETRELLIGSLRRVADFPKPGIRYLNLLRTVPSNPVLFGKVIELFAEHCRKQQVECVVGLEACGFVFGPPLALKLEVPFVPIRKAGKSPSPVKAINYELEYGESALEVGCEMISEGQRIMIVDDVLATGGTLRASGELLQQLGGNLLGACVLAEIAELNGRSGLKFPVFSIAALEE